MSFDNWTNKQTELCNTVFKSFLEDRQRDGVILTGEYVRMLVDEYAGSGLTILDGLAYELLREAVEESIDYDQLASAYPPIELEAE